MDNQDNNKQEVLQEILANNSTLVSPKKKKKDKKDKVKFKFVVRRCFFGIIKDISRISWHTKTNVLKESCVCLSIVFIFAVIFWGIDSLIMRVY